MKLALIGAAAVAAAAFATPAMAQAVIEDPGYCAQFYPNGNCQYLEPGIPYTDRGFRRGRERRDAGPCDRAEQARDVPLSWRTEVRLLTTLLSAICSVGSRFRRTRPPASPPPLLPQHS